MGFGWRALQLMRGLDCAGNSRPAIAAHLSDSRTFPEGEGMPLLKRESEIEAHLEELLKVAKVDQAAWARLKEVPLYWLTHGELVQRLKFGELLAEQPTRVLRQERYPQGPLPKPLEETSWDARSLQPDLQVYSRGAFVILEVKGATGFFHADGGPLQYAHGLCITPPNEAQDGTLGMVVVAPRSFFLAPSPSRIWEQWQIEFRRLTAKVPKFQWGIMLSDDLP